MISTLTVTVLQKRHEINIRNKLLLTIYVAMGTSVKLKSRHLIRHFIFNLFLELALFLEIFQRNIMIHIQEIFI